jgi:hypothetical protein
MSFQVDSINYFPTPSKFGTAGLGKLYLGVVNGNPANVPADRIQAYIVRQGLPNLAIDQPITLGAGGVPMYNGAPVQVEVEAGYSMQILDSTNSQIYYSASSGKVGASLAGINSQLADLYSQLSSRVKTIATVAALRTVVPDYVGQKFSLLGYTVAGTGGGQIYYVGTVANSSSDDGVLTFVSNVGGVFYQFKRTDYSRITIEMAGAIGDGVTLDTAAFQRAADALGQSTSETSTVYLGNKTYKLDAAIVVSSPVMFEGETIFDLENARGITRPANGTWITYASNTTLFSFTSNLGKGAGLRNIAIFQEGHAAPAGGWVPTVKPYVITNQNTQGTCILDRVHFHNVHKGVLTDHAARPCYSNITGQFFYRAFNFDRIYDIGQLNGLHAWTYWSEDNSVLLYMQANQVTLDLLRVDGLFASDIFTFGAATGVLTGESSYGGAARVIDITSLYCDFVGRAVVVNSTSPSHISIGSLFHLGQAWPATPFAAIASSCGISVDQGSNHLIQVSNYYSTVSSGSSVKVAGTSNQVWIGSEVIESYDVSASGAGAHTIAATNTVKLGSNPSIAKYGGGTAAEITGASAGIVQSPLIQQLYGTNTTNKVLASAGVAGGLAVLTSVGETDAGMALLASGAGVVQMGSASNKIAFYGGAAAVKGTLTGAKGGNVALTNLITYLAARGLFTDSTT